MIQERLDELVAFVLDYSEQHQGRGKDHIAAAVERRFQLVKCRRVYVASDFVMRFSEANTSSFSNTVLSLSALEKVDDRPVIICIVRPDSIQFLLANSTFLKKISHSSQQLRIDNIRGSFNGSDIVRTFAGLANAPENFEELFAAHQQFSWEDNVTRLAESTSSIVPTGRRFEPTLQQRDIILQAPARALEFGVSAEHVKLAQQLHQIACQKKAEILRAAQIDNINTRGNAIEQIITSTGNFHGCEDMSFVIELGPRVCIDVKTKVLDLSSNPKAYNVDKFLETLADAGTVFSFFFVGIDSSRQELKTALVSALDSTLLSATRVQFHWAGRNSRGVTQLSGAFSSVFEEDFEEHIDVDIACTFLNDLLSITPDTAAPE